MKTNIKFFTFIFLLGTTSIFAQEWQHDFNTAKELATKGNKPIILVFQGSDWCAPCIKLDREVWSTVEFKEYAKDHYVMLQADFPRRKQNALPEEQAAANAQLAEKYNKNGVFPFVVVMDNNGRVQGETSYQKMIPREYIQLLDSFIK